MLQLLNQKEKSKAFIGNQILVLAFVLFAIPAAGQFRYYENGVKFYNSAQYEEAIRNISEYLSKNSRDKNLDGNAVYVRALAYYKSKKFEQAINDFNFSFSFPQKKASANLFWLIGHCEAALNRNEAAIQSLTSALPLIIDSKKKAQLQFERAMLYDKILMKDLAEADLRNALLLDPEHYLAQAKLAELISTTSKKLMEKPVNVSSSSRVALIIGNGKYSPDVGKLKNPVNDAFSVNTALKNLNFQTVVKVNLSATEIKQTIKAFYDQLKAMDTCSVVALFYYAGHGLQFEGVNYMVPTDAVINDPSDIEKSCVSLNIVMDAMQYSNAKMSIMILDACRSNPFPKTKESVKVGFAPPDPTEGAFIAYATAPGTTASDGLADNGLYTQEMLKVLRIPGLTIEQVFKKVRENVLIYSNGKQHTWDTSNLVSDFYFSN